MEDYEHNELTKSLVAFQEFINKMCSLDVFHSLMLSILQISNKIKKENLSLTFKDWIEELLANCKLAKRLFSSDLSLMHSLLSKVIANMDSHSDDPGLLSQKIKTLCNWVVGVHVDIEHNVTENKLVDYYKELEELKTKFSDLSDISRKVGNRNEQLWETEEELSKALEGEKKRADKTTKKLDKVTKAYDDLKSKYSQLFQKYNDSQLEVDFAHKEGTGLGSKLIAEEGRRVRGVVQH